MNILTHVDRDVIDLATRFTTTSGLSQLAAWLDTTPSRRDATPLGTAAMLGADKLYPTVVGALQTEVGELLSIIRRQQAENERLHIVLSAAETDAAALASDALAGQA